MKFLEYWIYLLLSISKLFLFSLYAGTEFPFSFFVLNLASIVVLSSWTLLLGSKKRRWVLLALLFLHSTLLVSDLWYYRYFSDLLSIALLSDITQMSDVGGGFLTLIQMKDILFFADLLIFSVVLFAIRNRQDLVSRRQKRVFAGGGAALGLALFVIPLAASYTNEEEWLVDEPISNMREYYQLGFWGYHGLDFAQGVGSLFKNDSVTAEEESQIRKLNPNTPSAVSDSAKPNIIVVQLESFQTSVIDQQVNGQELTPNLNALKEETLFFPSFYHQTHEGRTSDAEFITLTSLHPLKSGSVYTQYADNEFDALPELLKAAGYDTAAMHAFEKDFWNRDDFYQNIGFNQFFSQTDFPDNQEIGMALNDEDFLTTSIELAEQLKEPYFAFMVALSSHTPYEIPAELEQLDLTGYEDPLLKGYYETIHYVDGAVGLMIEELKQKDMWDDSLVVFYGDHDSGLTQPRSEMAKELGAETEVELFELDHQVPLFIKQPNTDKGTTIEDTGGQIDIAPTILDIVDIEPSYMLGQSLLDEDSNLTIFRHGAFRYEEFYFEPDLTKPGGSGTCYETASGEEVGIEQCSEQIETAADQLRISDLIIQKNALQKIGQSEK
ncbi:phosphoglycerol transferase MdoB-like AlkP superfamily enzyme [Planomicrobium stackebrandtii]|uniref:Phosphoglycerol transferase MdoB-like AlkP superfamily enzyme n=1 Tax=Planomicrobium stackebrandtii TaxID=253160 RepID=A0ABU0GTL2_9BACL|nr:LTA synthase family protein [Planomicrobium stackebrandtii]MDQ0428681.1 phosphoglycerol transferase MdoB-like AlkP superfamily enzyme [Planomicrobium stackebrandtii]